MTIGNFRSIGDVARSVLADLGRAHLVQVEIEIAGAHAAALSTSAASSDSRCPQSGQNLNDGWTGAVQLGHA